MKRPDASTRHDRVQREYYARTNPRITPADSEYVRRHVDRVVAFGALHRSERILDVGCGMGKFTLPLHERGFQVEGLDLSPDLIRQLRERVPDPEDLPLHCADLTAPPRELEGAFDVVVGFFALHHLRDLPGAFRAIRRYLRPGGRVVFLEPNAYNPLYYLQITFTPGMSWRADRGLVSMRRTRLVRALAGAGFADVHLTREGMFPPALINRRWGARLEEELDRSRVLHRVSAFQLLRGRLA